MNQILKQILIGVSDKKDTCIPFKSTMCTLCNSYYRNLLAGTFVDRGRMLAEAPEGNISLTTVYQIDLQ